MTVAAILSTLTLIGCWESPSSFTNESRSAEIADTQNDDVTKQIENLRGQWPATYIYPKNTTRVLFSDEPYRFLMVIGDQVVVEDTALDNRATRRMALEGIKGSDVTDMAFSKDGKFVGLATQSHTTLWDADRANLIATLHENEHAELVQFSPSGRYLFTASKKSGGRLWDGRTGEPIASMNGHSEKITLVRFNKNESIVLTAAEDQTAGAWEVKTGKRIHTLKHEGAITNICFSPNEESILTSGGIEKAKTGTIKVWDAKNAKLKFKIKQPSAVTASYRSDGKQIVSVSNGAIAWWNAENGKQQNEIKLAGIKQDDARFVPDGQHLVVFYKQQALLWSLFHTQPINKFKKVGDSVSDSFSGNLEAGYCKFYSLSSKGAFRKWHIKQERSRK